MRIWIKFLDWLGSARRLNDDISSDAVRIASLEQANKALTAKLNQSKVAAMVWQTKAEDLQDKLDEARNTIGVSDAQYEGAQAALKAARSEIEELEANEETNWPLISYALRQKANRAKYDAKRRRK